MTAQIIELPKKATASEVIPFFRERGQMLKSRPEKGKNRRVVNMFAYTRNSNDDLPPTAA